MWYSIYKPTTNINRQTQPHLFSTPLIPIVRCQHCDYKNHFQFSNFIFLKSLYYSILLRIDPCVKKLKTKTLTLIVRTFSIEKKWCQHIIKSFSIFKFYLYIPFSQKLAKAVFDNIQLCIGRYQTFYFWWIQ